MDLPETTANFVTMFAAKILRGQVIALLLLMLATIWSTTQLTVAPLTDHSKAREMLCFSLPFNNSGITAIQ
jgi:hypothetical protein|tara:strand:+ start:3395 stop:3607 length:213 start_codon:yes stop_codon:yes gene_type:complete